MTSPEIVALLDSIEAQWQTVLYELVDALIMDDRSWPGSDDQDGTL